MACGFGNRQVSCVVNVDVVLIVLSLSARQRQHRCHVCIVLSQHIQVALAIPTSNDINGRSKMTKKASWLKSTPHLSQL